MDLPQLETFLQSNIFPDLDKGRPDWDKKHTQAVIFHLKDILTHSPQFIVDSQVLLISAYAHDWGYSGIYKNGQRIQPKDNHMLISAQKIDKLLQQLIFNFLSSSQKRRIVDLVQFHDDLKHKTKEDEIILFESDTLGALDVSFVKPTFSPSKNAQWLSDLLSQRLPLFITPYGRSKFKRLFELRRNYYSV